MKLNENLYNAAVIGENAESADVAFIVEGKRLHAVEKSVAELEKEKSNPKLVLNLLRDAYTELQKFASGKAPQKFIDFISLKAEEYDQLLEKIANIYFHLPHSDRNELSSLIHHKATK
jgi:hypothetical protein